MTTCKDCVHYEMCRIVYRNGDDRVLKNSPCKYFKNKADFVEVKHGYWIDDIQGFTTVAGVRMNGVVGYKCSLCGRKELSKEPYCNCGAKMDGGKTNENQKGC